MTETRSSAEDMSSDIDWRKIIEGYVTSKDKRALTPQERNALHAVLSSVVEKNTSVAGADVYFGQVLLKLNRLLSEVGIEITYPVVDKGSFATKEDLYTFSLFNRYLADIQFVEGLRMQLPALSLLLSR